MYKAIIFITVLLTADAAFAQTSNSVKITVRNKDIKENVVDAKVIVKETDISGTTNANGSVELANIPDGEQIFEISSLGHETVELKLTFPLADPTERIVFFNGD